MSERAKEGAGGAIRRRKGDHVRICLRGDVGSSAGAGLDHLRLVHTALPEIDLASVDTGDHFLGRPVGMPIVVSAGLSFSPADRRLALRLLSAAREHRLPFFLGSQRLWLEEGPPSSAVLRSIRSAASTIPVVANVGAVQLRRGWGGEQLRRIVGMAGACAICLHLNPLQEALQEEGDTCFAGLLDAIAGVRRDLELPLIVKETGCGLSAADVVRLAGAGVDMVEVAGAGGTNWGLVEGLRRPASSAVRIASRAFSGWGNRTAEVMLALAGQAGGSPPLIASGGVRNGVEAALCLALGAEAVGIGLPLVRTAAAGPAALDRAIEALRIELRTALFCTGCASPAVLRGRRDLVIED